MYCWRCGAIIPDGKSNCADCGASVYRFDNADNASDKILSQPSTETTNSSSRSNGMAIAGFVCSFFFPILG